MISSCVSKSTTLCRAFYCGGDASSSCSLSVAVGFADDGGGVVVPLARACIYACAIAIHHSYLLDKPGDKCYC